MVCIFYTAKYDVYNVLSLYSEYVILARHKLEARHGYCPNAHNINQLPLRSRQASEAQAVRVNDRDRLEYHRKKTSSGGHLRDYIQLSHGGTTDRASVGSWMGRSG